MHSAGTDRRAFLVLVLATTCVFAWMVGGFLIPVFWAIVLAVLFRRVFVRWNTLVRGKRSLAAFFTTLTVILLIVVPLGLVLAAVTAQAVDLYEGIEAGTLDVRTPIAWVQRSIPALTNLLSSYGIDAAQVQASVESAAVQASRFMATQALAFGQGLLRFTALFFLALYLLFFFVRDWERILDTIVRVVPLGDLRIRRLFAKFAEVSRATMKGTVAVAVLQGAIGGVLFAIVGIDGAVFWGVVMTFLSLMPVVGTLIVWGPAAIILIAMGSIWKGVVVVAGGILVIGLVDNVLRPILVGHETKMPDYLVLISTLGGLTAFGASGVVIGPFIAALFLVVWEMMGEDAVMVLPGQDPGPQEAFPRGPVGPPSTASERSDPEIGTGTV